MANPARAYLATQVETTSQGELLLMLYEAAIKFLKRAKIEIDNKDFAKKGVYISKAMAIIHELAESLNKEKGGDITPQLSQLYMFCTSHLIKANIRMSTKMLDEVIDILDGLRSAYAQIVPTYESGGAAATAPNMGAAPKPASLPTPPPAPTQEQKAQPAPAAPKAEAAEPPQQPTPQSEADPAPAADPAQSQQAQQPTPPPQSLLKQPPKMRSAFSAAKFRAANAYSNNR